MKNEFVIFVGSLKKGGVERFAALLANHLVELGHEVKLLTLSDEIAFDLDKRISREVIKRDRYKFRLVNIIAVYLNIMRVVWGARPKRLITLSRIGGLFASATFYPKTIVSFDIYPLLGYKKYKEWQFWTFYNTPWVRTVVSCSEELRSDVKKYFINKRKIKVIPYPVPIIDTDQYREYKNEVTDKKYFVVVARLSSQKNIDHIIKAYSQCKVQDKVDILILGDGPLRENLDNYIKDLKLQENIHLMGFVRDPYPLMRNAVCLVNASFREGFPNVIVESLGLGTPVISSLAKTGPKEMIFDEENGLLFPVNDIEMLASYMNEVILNDELYSHLRANATKGIDRFSHENIMKKWENILLDN